MITEADIERWFTYHPPTAEQRAAYEQIRQRARVLAAALVSDETDANDGPGESTRYRLVQKFRAWLAESVPTGIEQDEADELLHMLGDDVCEEYAEEILVARLRGAVMWANAAIACAPSNASKISNGSAGEGWRRCPCGAPIYPGEICNCGRDFEGSTE